MASSKQFPYASSTSALVEGLQRYVEADSTDERLELLIEIAASDDGRLARAALRHLVDRPKLLVSVNGAQRKRLRATVSQSKVRLLPLAWVLARLEDREAAPLLVERMRELREKRRDVDVYGSDKPRWALVVYRDYKDLGRPLELLLNHEHPAVGPGTRHSDVESIVEDFDEYLSEHAGGDFERGFEERGLPVPQSRSELADRIRKGPDKLDRVVALERCERKIGRKLYPFQSYVDGVADDFWSDLGDACEKGKPVRHLKRAGHPVE